MRWLHEAGIGEARAALIDDGEIVEARVERDDGGPRLGAVTPARLVRTLSETGRAVVRIESGVEAILKPLPKTSEGAALRVVVVREAIPERGNPKPAWVRLALDDEPDTPGESLLDRLEATGLPVTTPAAHQTDLLEQAGWSEVLEQAQTGLIPFVGGLLRLSLTPAMSLFDVDGGLAPRALSVAGAEAAARAIRRFDIGGSIGIDLPANLKDDRIAAAEAIDRALAQPFERTAVNGFGFVQIVRRRQRASLPELIQSDCVTAAALALLRRAERTPGAGPRTLVASDAVIDRVGGEQGWRTELARRIGAPVALRVDPALPISGGHVEVPNH